MAKDERANRFIVVQIQDGQLGLHLRVGGERDDVRVVGMEQRLASLLAPDLELGNRRELEPLDQQQLAGRDVLDLLVERRLRRAAQLVHQHPAARRGDQDLGGAGVPVAPLLKNVGLRPEATADSEERLSVQSQIKFLGEAAIALKDDCLGFTLAREHDPREIGLLYYVMASSQTLGDALKRVARYSQITNEALVVRYREGNGLIISLIYSGRPSRQQKARGITLGNLHKI